MNLLSQKLLLFKVCQCSTPTGQFGDALMLAPLNQSLQSQVTVSAENILGISFQLLTTETLVFEVRIKNVAKYKKLIGFSINISQFQGLRHFSF